MTFLEEVLPGYLIELFSVHQVHIRGSIFFVGKPGVWMFHSRNCRLILSRPGNMEYTHTQAHNYLCHGSHLTLIFENISYITHNTPSCSQVAMHENNTKRCVSKTNPERKSIMCKYHKQKVSNLRRLAERSLYAGTSHKEQITERKKRRDILNSCRSI